MITEIYSCGHRVKRKVNPVADPAKVYSHSDIEVKMDVVCWTCYLLGPLGYPKPDNI
jgi:hypothetical protein